MKINQRETAIDAYHAMEESGVLNRSRFQVLMAIFRNPHRTGNEIAKILSKAQISSSKESSIFRVKNVYARINELCHAGLIVDSGKRPCETSGVMGLTWVCTKSWPDELRFKPEKSEKKCYVLFVPHEGKNMVVFKSEKKAKRWQAKHKKFGELVEGLFIK